VIATRVRLTHDRATRTDDADRYRCLLFPRGPRWHPVAVEIKLRAFPSRDREFAAFARAAWEALGSAPTPEALRQAVRQRYPAAIVRPQDELARHGEGPLVWYVFRTATLGVPDDDTDSAGASDSDGAWDSTGAWAVLDDHRRFVEISPALEAIAELPARHMIGHRIEEFSNPLDPTIREDIVLLWSEFVRRRSIASTLRFNFADGRPRELAYRLVADADGAGRHRLTVAIVPEVEPPP
jgi:PAS domain-containing protein